MWERGNENASVRGRDEERERGKKERECVCVCVREREKTVTYFRIVQHLIKAGVCNKRFRVWHFVADVVVPIRNVMQHWNVRTSA